MLASILRMLNKVKGGAYLLINIFVFIITVAT